MRAAWCIGGPMAGKEFSAPSITSFRCYIPNPSPIRWQQNDIKPTDDLVLDTKEYIYHEIAVPMWELGDIMESRIIVPVWLYEDTSKYQALALVESGVAIVKALMPHYT